MDAYPFQKAFLLHNVGMAKPIETVTPPNRMERWKKLWGTPRKLEGEALDLAFEEFEDALVPRHMHKLFLKSFGQPKSKFGNRFFADDSIYRNWDMKISQFAGEGEHVEATIIYGSPDKLEGHVLRGERRRSLRDIVIDDWHAACVIVRAGKTTLYVFVEPKMKGCIVRTVVEGGVVEEVVPEELIEKDYLTRGELH